MALAKLKPKISVEEYLESEKFSQIKHEYLDGEIYAMSGVSKQHNRISRRLLRKLENRMEETECETFYNEVKLRVKHLNRFYYPDLVVVFGQDEEHKYYITKLTPTKRSRG